MKTNICLLSLLILLGSFLHLSAQEPMLRRDAFGRLYTVTYENNDSTYWVNMSPLYVFPPMQFKNKRQEKFYWKTVRDVKKTLPYAKIVSKMLNDANRTLDSIPDPAERKKYLKNLEKDVTKQYEKDIRKMTFNQGKILIRLIDRETNMTSYDLIKMYRGSITAIFWQGIARIFGANLKDEYDAADKDQIIERVIILVEAGQL